jgi:hypothetical protein
VSKHEKLAWSVVRPLEQYLILKNQVGSGVYDARLEVLLGRVDVQVVSDPFAAEALERFKASPTDSLVTQTLYLQLIRHLRDDPEFGRRLREALSTAPPGTRRSRTRVARRAMLWTAGVAVLLLTGFLWGRSTSAYWPDAAATPPSAEIPVRPTTAPPVSPGTTASTTVPAPTVTTDRTTSVLLETLPATSWRFGHGDRDVQGTTYPSSMWAELSTCEDEPVAQQFQVKGFRRLEVQALGADSASARASIKFEVLDSGDKVLKEVVVVEGGVGEMVVDLPHDTSTITLRNSLVNTDEPGCEPVHAVWGSPRVIAAGR